MRQVRNFCFRDPGDGEEIVRCVAVGLECPADGLGPDPWSALYSLLRVSSFPRGPI